MAQSERQAVVVWGVCLCCNYVAVGVATCVELCLSVWMYDFDAEEVFVVAVDNVCYIQRVAFVDKRHVDILHVPDFRECAILLSIIFVDESNNVISCLCWLTLYLVNVNCRRLDFFAVCLGLFYKAEVEFMIVLHVVISCNDLLLKCYFTSVRSVQLKLQDLALRADCLLFSALYTRT